MKFVKGKKMEESDLCMFLEDLGVVLDRATWTHFKEVYASSHDVKENGKKLLFVRKISLSTCFSARLAPPDFEARPGHSGLERTNKDASTAPKVDETDAAAHGKLYEVIIIK